MSVITYHEIRGNDIFDRLVKEGVIYEGDIFSPRRGEYRHYRYVFDYTKCDARTCAELDSCEAEKKRLFVDRVNENDSLSAEQKAELIANRDKCDYHLMPVIKTESGGVAWLLNYGSDERPSIAVGRMYPDEIFEYKEATEGCLDISYKFKEDNLVTDDGQPYNGSICRISNKLIHPVDADTVQVFLYVSSTDKAPALLYCPVNDIRPTDYSGEHTKHKGYSDVVFRDRNAKIKLQRTLGDGTSSNELWSFSKLSEAVWKEKHRYYMQKRAEKENNC